jgi:hypothetical protein
MTSASSEECCDGTYELACRLCDAGQFGEALPMAMQLVAQAHTSRHCFIAATCLQRLRKHHLAARMYAMCLSSDPHHVPALYRFGECMACGDEEDDAAASFDWKAGLPDKNGLCARRALPRDLIRKIAGTTLILVLSSGALSAGISFSSATSVLFLASAALGFATGALSSIRIIIAFGNRPGRQPSA